MSDDLKLNNMVIHVEPSVLVSRENWDKATARIDELETENARLKAVLGRPDHHLVKITSEDWTVQHPPTCEDLFDCWASHPTWTEAPAPNGVYRLLEDFSLENTDG